MGAGTGLRLAVALPGEGEDRPLTEAQLQQVYEYILRRGGLREKNIQQYGDQRFTAGKPVGVYLDGKIHESLLPIDAIIDALPPQPLPDPLDADTLDGLDSTAFAPAVHTHPPGDATTLDGKDSSDFVQQGGPANLTTLTAESGGVTAPAANTINSAGWKRVGTFGSDATRSSVVIDLHPYGGTGMAHAFCRIYASTPQNANVGGGGLVVLGGSTGVAGVRITSAGGNKYLEINVTGSPSGGQIYAKRSFFGSEPHAPFTFSAADTAGGGTVLLEVASGQQGGISASGSIVSSDQVHGTTRIWTGGNINADGAIAAGSYITAVGQMLGKDGTAASPSQSFTNEQNMGLWRSVGQLNFSVGGTNRAALTASGMTVVPPVLESIGSEAAPSYAFTGEAGTGMWKPAANTIAFSTSGVERARLGSVQLQVEGKLVAGASTFIAKLQPGVQLTLAAGGVQALGNIYGMLVITAVSGNTGTALYLLIPSTVPVLVGSVGSAVWGTAAGVGTNQYNLYATGATNVSFENKSSTTRQFSMVLLGAYSSA